MNDFIGENEPDWQLEAEHIPVEPEEPDPDTSAKEKTLDRRCSDWNLVRPCQRHLRKSVNPSKPTAVLVWASFLAKIL